MSRRVQLGALVVVWVALVSTMAIKAGIEEAVFVASFSFAFGLLPALYRQVRSWAP